MKLATTFVVVLGLTLSGCSKKKEEGTAQKQEPGTMPKAAEPTKTEEPPPPKPMTGPELADKYKACTAMINDAKWEDFKKECVADTYVAHANAGMPEMKGVDGLVAYFQSQKTAMPDWKIQPQLVMVSGRNILAVNLSTGTQSGPMKTPMGEVPASNKKMGMLFFHRLAINDANKVTDEWAYADAATMMGQLGLAPKGTPPSRAATDAKPWEGAPIVAITADDAKEKANLEAVKKSNEAFIANKPADAMAVMTDDAVESDQAVDKDHKGKKEIEKGFSEFRNAWTDVKLSNVEMWAAGDYVVQTFKFEAKHEKDLGKIKKTGKTVSLDAAEVMHFKDGKIDRLWRFMNGVDFAMQLGLMPAPGTAPQQPKMEEPAKK